MSEYTQVRKIRLGLLPASLLKTGQTTSYHVGDDGDLELGVAHSYRILTTGQYSGTFNITINGKTYAFSNACVKDNNTGKMWARAVPQSDIGPANDGKLFWDQYAITGENVTFAEVGGPGTDTITAAAGNPFSTGALCVGRIFTVSGPILNAGPFTVAAIAGNVITTVEDLADEGPVATDFASVDDLVCDLVDQANTGSGLARHTDWRLPNRKELESIVDIGHCSPTIDATTFPSTPANYHWTASTYPCDTNNAWFAYFSTGYVHGSKKCTNKYYIHLVR